MNITETLTPEQIEAAYRYQKRQYAIADAEEAIKAIVYGDDNYDCLEDSELAAAEDTFVEKMGYDLAHALSFAGKVADRFLTGYDCTQAASVQLKYYAQEVLDEVKVDEANFKPLTFMGCVQLLDTLCKKGLLRQPPDDKDSILAYRLAGEENPEGWYAENILSSTAPELVNDIPGQLYLWKQLKAWEKQYPEDAFLYGDKHFVPAGRFPHSASFRDIILECSYDDELGYCTPNHGRPSKFPYTYADFISIANRATGTQDIDVFLCLENGKLYTPATYYLYEWAGKEADLC